MKAYTDLEQSKKLAEILPPESADMYYYKDNVHAMSVYHPNIIIPSFGVRNMPNYGEGDVPCWSLPALLEQLKAEIQLENKQILFLHINKYNDINYDIRYTNSWTGEVLTAKANNLIDACVAMIEKLNEQLNVE